MSRAYHTKEGTPSMNTLNAANNIQTDLVQTLFNGQKAMTDLAMKQTAVNMQAQTQMEQQSTALQAVAMMTGIGTQLDTVA